MTMTPSYEALCKIWSDMVARVGHHETCRDPKCKHDDDPPSYFETETVRRFTKGTSPTSRPCCVEAYARGYALGKAHGT